MSVDDARKTLEAHGFTLGTVPGQPWGNAVAIAVAQARGTASPPFNSTDGARRIEAHKGGESVTIEPIRPGPNGGIVMFVGYSAPLAAHPMTQIQADSAAKFGGPSRTYPDGSMVWCASGPSCNPRAEARPWLKLSAAGDNAFLSLEGGTSTEAFASKVLSDAVAAKVGKSTSSF